MLLVPSSVFIASFSEPVTRLLYERGDWGPHDTSASAIVLVALALGLTFNGLTLLLIRSLYSLRRVWVPTLVSVATLGVNLAVALGTYRTWGVAGVAFATSAANLVGVVLLYSLLRRHTAPLGTLRTVAVGAGTLVAAGVAVGISAAGYYLFWEPTFGNRLVALLGGVTAALAIAAPIYLRVGVLLRAVRPGLLRSLRRRSTE
jgi:putative peptidoglycan lipid II flippase